jgi:hypothetical protein
MLRPVGRCFCWILICCAVHTAVICAAASVALLSACIVDPQAAKSQLELPGERRHYTASVIRCLHRWPVHRQNGGLRELESEFEIVHLMPVGVILSPCRV